MGRSAAEGVVDPYGQVFGYPGLHVADGAIVPGTIGEAPALTIAALADRTATAILEGARSRDCVVAVIAPMQLAELPAARVNGVLQPGRHPRGVCAHS
jgi:cholesterol oxidase